MDTVIALLEIAERDSDPLLNALPAHIADYLDAGATTGFLEWLEARQRVTADDLARLHRELEDSLFACPSCGRVWPGRDLGNGQHLRCPACISGELVVHDTARHLAEVTRMGGGSSAELTALRTDAPTASESGSTVSLPPTSEQALPVVEIHKAAEAARAGEPDAPAGSPAAPGAESSSGSVTVRTQQHADHSVDDDRVVHPTGRWVVVERVGSGSMGEVWKAWNEVLGQFTAVKVLTHPDKLSVERFRREARAYGQLDHPNIVRVRDIGKFRGRPAIMLEWVDGGTVKDALDAGYRFATAEVLRIGIDAADALAAAHTIGLVHRDIKPANLLRGKGGRVKVTDFGIARTGDSRLTAVGAIIGTPAYISPEQVTSGRAVEASDIYSLGATLFHLLTGHQPFTARSAAAMMNAHATRRIPSIAACRDDLPPGLERLVQQMTAHNPAKRPDARTVADRLREMRALLAAGHVQHSDSEVSRRVAAPAPAAPDTRPQVATQPLRRGGGTEVCRVSAPLDRTGWNHIADAIRQRAAAGVTCLILDLVSSSSNVSLAGVTALGEAAREVGPGVMIAVAATDRRLHILLDMVAAPNLRLFGSVADAVAALGVGVDTQQKPDSRA